LITYNGKSFDWPLLRTRFVLSRLPVPALPPHIDLQHICRRLWKERLPSVRLTDMEREILRFEREDDLPGAEIPARYFEFLRGGSPDRLCPVLEHNQNDLIALAALLGAVMDQFDRTRMLANPADALGFGKVALRAREIERARAFGDDAFATSTCAREARAALVFRAEVERKLGRVPEAIALLQRVIELAAPGDNQRTSGGHARAETLAQHEAELASVHFCLAKLYEHEQRDFARALVHARNTESAEGPELHGRRLGRLYRRLLRSAEDKA
jgi:tetratricopeptide (TPR) repeat protein